MEERIRKIWRILDNLTPEKFQTSVQQIKELPIDSLQKLEELVNLIFEKAIAETSFCVLYANICKQLALIKVPLDDGKGAINFRKLLLTKCQKEFEQDKSSEKKREDMIQAMKAAKNDKEKFKELQLELQEEEKTVKKRQLGNIRFIGELFKLNMLIEPIMHECIKKLLAQGDEGSLECLCCLLESIGNQLDEKGSKSRESNLMDSYFVAMQRIVDKRLTSSRVEFMLQNVIDLRKNGWIPMRNGNNPKTTDQIHKEAEKETLEDQKAYRNINYSKRIPDDRRRISGYPSQENMSLSDASNYLAVNLHQLLAKEKANVFFSPFSISIAMGMLLCGAEGETATELRAALGHEFAGIKKEDVASVFEKIISNILQHNDSYTLSLANSMLSQKNFGVKDEYKRIISDFFKALLSEVDFKHDNKNVVNKINKWVKENTNNKIPKFVDSIHPDNLLVLLNAIYFKGTWMKKFEKKGTKSEKFYNNGMENKAKKVDMMHMTDSFPFYEESDHLALMLPYVGEEVAMVFILPHEKNGLDSLEATLTPSFFQDFKKKFRKTKVKIAIPRFHLEYEKDLVSSFEELGVHRVFGDAELTNLSDEGGLFVNIILHKAVLDVNEEGSEAAAATMVAIGRSFRPSCSLFFADHPFTFVIYSIKNDLILFMGRVNEL